jgi:hypothetical protein
VRKSEDKNALFHLHFLKNADNLAAVFVDDGGRYVEASFFEREVFSDTFFNVVCVRLARIGPVASPTTTVTATPTATPDTSAPIVKIASAKKVARAAGTSVAVAAIDADSVRITVRQGRKKLVSDTLPAGGGAITLPALATGAVKITVVAKNDDGTARAKRTLRVR